jgi:iron complex transport system substrate-binding protein
MLFALGLGDQVVAVTHECDHPPEAASKPHLTRSVIPDGLDAAEIDAFVRAEVGAGRHLYELNEAALAELRVDLICTQAVCDVCAVSYEDVRAVAERLPSHPEVISLDPERLTDVLADARRLGEAAAAPEAAATLSGEIGRRLAQVRSAVAGAGRPRVLALEWLDPVFIAGHWVPEMVEIAGGVDALGIAGARSRPAGWEEAVAAGADVVVAMPCGWDSERARREVLSHAERVATLGAARVFAVDAAASFSRPGPRLVEGTELLAHMLHPDRVKAPAGVAFGEVRLPQKAKGWEAAMDDAQWA